MTALTPDDLARIEARADLEAEGWHSSRPDDSVCVQSRADVLALVAGVRSLQARITELETVALDVPQQRNVVRELDRELVLGGLGDSSSSGWLDALNRRGYVIARRAGADHG